MGSPSLKGPCGGWQDPQYGPLGKAASPQERQGQDPCWHLSDYSQDRLRCLDDKTIHQLEAGNSSKKIPQDLHKPHLILPRQVPFQHVEGACESGTYRITAQPLGPRLIYNPSVMLLVFLKGTTQLGFELSIISATTGKHERLSRSCKRGQGGATGI